MSRPWLSPSPRSCARARPISDGSVTGTRSTNQTPSGKRVRHLLRDPERQPGLADAARADRGDQAVLRQGGAQRGDLGLAADERGQRGRERRRRASVRATPRPVRRGTRPPPARARVGRLTWSLRSSEETWLSTVRTEMNRRAAISALVRCSETAARTSASRADTAVSAETRAPVTPMILHPRRGGARAHVTPGGVTLGG